MTGKNNSDPRPPSKVRHHNGPKNWNYFVSAFEFGAQVEKDGYSDSDSVFVSVFIYSPDEDYAEHRARTATQIKAFEALWLKDDFDGTYTHTGAGYYHEVDGEDKIAAL